MALFYQHNINEGTKTGIWRIEEQEDFFLEKVPVKRDVSHPYKRLQHLAGRFLLPALFADFPMNDILIADTRKPFLENEQYHFSISHCGNFAAAIVSNHQRVGVDIELVTPRIISISDKFLHPDEKLFLQDWEPLSKIYLDLVTVLWSAKESVFKWYGKGGVDFRQHIRLSGDIIFKNKNQLELPFLFLKEEAAVQMTVYAQIMNPLVLAFLYT